MIDGLLSKKKVRAVESVSFVEQVPVAFSINPEGKSQEEEEEASE